MGTPRSWGPTVRQVPCYTPHVQRVPPTGLQIPGERGPWPPWLTSVSVARSQGVACGRHSIDRLSEDDLNDILRNQVSAGVNCTPAALNDFSDPLRA